MNPSLEADAREQWIRQLLYFEEQGPQFLNDYGPSGGPERFALDHLIERYMARLEELLKGKPQSIATILHSEVLIGSRVRVRDRDNGAVDEFTLVFPLRTDPERYHISFLSPIGRQLLLGSAGDWVSLQVPGGRLNVTIEDVDYAQAGAWEKIS